LLVVTWYSKTDLIENNISNNSLLCHVFTAMETCTLSRSYTSDNAYVVTSYCSLLKAACLEKLTCILSFLSVCVNGISESDQCPYSTSM
jgi:hypothetical protein